MDTWKELAQELDIVFIEKLVGEYLINTFPVLNYIHYKVYESLDGEFYAIPNIKLKDCATNMFIHPKGVGASPTHALRNVLTQIGRIAVAFEARHIEDYYQYCEISEY